jgi:hypothetical protein
MGTAINGKMNGLSPRIHQRGNPRKRREIGQPPGNRNPTTRLAADVAASPRDEPMVLRTTIT